MNKVWSLPGSVQRTYGVCMPPGSEFETRREWLAFGSGAPGSLVGTRPTDPVHGVLNWLR